MQNHITKLTKKLTKKTVIDVSSELLELEFTKKNSIKTKCLKYVVKKILPNHKNFIL